MQDLTAHEKMYIRRAIWYLKFMSLDHDAGEFARSSYANSILDKLFDDLDVFYKSYGVQIEKHPPIDMKTNVISCVINHIKNVHSPTWEGFDANTKEDIIKELLYPHKYSDETIKNILSQT
jgi:hypothetical protein